MPHHATHAVPSHGPRLQRKGLKVSLEIAPAVPALVYGDPNRLRQVISNFM
jgi:signal transduction histidine kinase